VTLHEALEQAVDRPFHGTIDAHSRRESLHTSFNFLARAQPEDGLG